MGHRNYKWNITKEEGSKLVLNYIKEILNNQKNGCMAIEELTLLINNRSKHVNITNNNKKKSLINFINSNYGSLVHFADDYDSLIVIFNGKNVTMKVYESQESYNLFNEWICVE